MKGNPSACWDEDVISASRHSCVRGSGRLGLCNGENWVYAYPVLRRFGGIWHFATGIG